MAVYLWENVHLVPGMTAEYTRGYEERWLRLSDKYDRDFLRVSGFFLPNVFNATNPTVNILWTVDSWESWGNSRRRGTPEEVLEKGQVFRCGDNQDLSNSRQHQHRKRVIDHWFVVYRHELLAHAASDRIKA